MTESFELLRGEGKVHPDIPNAARMYDYYLGGAHNFPADRALADQAHAVLPCVPMVARLNRSFLRRAVLFMVERGIRQFLDLGSGIPTEGNVHEVAQSHDAGTRVMYVDYEPVAVSHSDLILAEIANAAVIEADVRRPAEILNNDQVRALLNFDEPLGLLMVGVLLFIPDSDDPAGLVATYRDICVPGSYLALSHITDDDADPVTTAQVRELVDVYQNASEQVYVRDRKTFTGWFDGTELVEPGVTLLADWRPDGPIDAEAASPARMLGYGGVGHVL